VHATVHVYDDMLGVALPISQASGVAFAPDREADYDLYDAVRIAEDVVEASPVERPEVT